MKTGKKPRKKYDREFILHAVRMVTEEERSVIEVARSLGIHYQLLYRWKCEFEKDPVNAFPGKGNIKPEDAELRRLQRENYSLKQQRDILKKALAIFSKEPQKNTYL
jgi:transposase